MKKILTVCLLAFSMVGISFQELSAEKPNYELLAAQSNLVFRSNQRVRDRSTGEEVWFERSGAFKIYQNGEKVNSGTYSISGKYITFYTDYGSEIGYGTYTQNNSGGIAVFSFSGHTYYPV